MCLVPMDGDLNENDKLILELNWYFMALGSVSITVQTALPSLSLNCLF